MRMTLAASAGIAAAAATVAAQPSPSFAYVIDAPAALAAGATATITVLCAFSPGVGQLVSTPIGPYPVWGLESGGFSIQGSGGQWAGLSLLPPLNFPFGTTAGTAAGGNVSGVIWGTGFVPPASPSTVNPTPIWRGSFTMPSVSATIGVVPNAFAHGLWVSNAPTPITLFVNGPAVGAQTAILVLCYPDCNEDGALTIADFGCFQTRFVAADPYADCNGDGALTVADFGCFQTRFFVGCP